MNKRQREASMTVEAAFVLPVFLFAMLLLAFLAQMARCQDEVQWALTRVAREVSAEYGAAGKDALVSRVYILTKLERYLDGSGLSISLLHSELGGEQDEIDLIADYRMKVPFRLLPVRKYTFRARVHTRAFTGVEDRGAERDHAGDREVYITETGRVYHDSLSCTYLKLSISQLQFDDVDGMRNESGGKYKPCERCCRTGAPSRKATVWITNFGDRYHVSRSCSGLKRKIRTIRLSEAGKRTPCSKCGKE